MRRCVIVLTTLFALAVDSPRSADAGAFATEFTQLLNHAQLILQYIQQGQQLAVELAMYADMLHNSRTLGSQTFGSVGADIAALAKPWASQDFFVRDRLSGENIPATIVRLPSGSPAVPGGYDSDSPWPAAPNRREARCASICTAWPSRRRG